VRICCSPASGEGSGWAVGGHEVGSGCAVGGTNRATIQGESRGVGIRCVSTPTQTGYACRCHHTLGVRVLGTEAQYDGSMDGSVVGRGWSWRGTAAAATTAAAVAVCALGACLPPPQPPPHPTPYALLGLSRWQMR